MPTQRMIAETKIGNDRSTTIYRTKFTTDRFAVLVKTTYPRARRHYRWFLVIAPLKAGESWQARDKRIASNVLTRVYLGIKGVTHNKRSGFAITDATWFDGHLVPRD